MSEIDDGGPAWLSDVAIKVEPCGSRVTCMPAPTDTDRDYLVQIKDGQADVARFVETAAHNGFQWEGGLHYQVAATTFMSWRSGDINLIVTCDATFAEKHRLATSLAKRFNLLAKEDRVALFQAVLYGQCWPTEEQLRAALSAANGSGE